MPCNQPRQSHEQLQCSQACNLQHAVRPAMANQRTDATHIYQPEQFSNTQHAPRNALQAIATNQEKTKKRCNAALAMIRMTFKMQRTRQQHAVQDNMQCKTTCSASNITTEIACDIASARSNYSRFATPELIQKTRLHCMQ